MLNILFKPSAKENTFRTKGDDIGYCRARPAAENWRTFARSVKSSAPRHGEPASTELEKLLTKDPYVVTVKPKKTMGQRARSFGRVLPSSRHRTRTSAPSSRMSPARTPVP